LLTAGGRDVERLTLDRNPLDGKLGRAVNRIFQSVCSLCFSN
jgi:hypothetical protein